MFEYYFRFSGLKRVPKKNDQAYWSKRHKCKNHNLYKMVDFMSTKNRFHLYWIGLRPCNFGQKKTFIKTKSMECANRLLIAVVDNAMFYKMYAIYFSNRKISI